MQITSFICLVITSQPPSSATAKSSIFFPAFISVFTHYTKKWKDTPDNTALRHAESG